MNPETITTGQLLSSFTARHWTAVISAMLSLFASIGYGGYWLGQTITTSRQTLDNFEVRTALARTESQLDAANDDLKQAHEMIENCENARKQSRAAVEEQKASIAIMSEKLSRENNCTFIHDQIVATQAEITGHRGIFVYPPSEEDEKNEKERIASLQRRLEIYQRQLSTCSK